MACTPDQQAVDQARSAAFMRSFYASLGMSKQTLERAISHGNQPTSSLAITSSSGTYQLGPLQPGRYQIEFLAGCGASGYKTQWWKNASSARTATPASTQCCMRAA